MSYSGDGEINAVFRPHDDVESLRLRSTTAGFVAPGSLTDGRFGLFRWDMEARAGGASPHFQRTFSESFFILDGEVELYNGDDWVNGTAGDFIFVPEGGVHGFRNTANHPASMLILFAPGPPRERYFHELAEIAASGRQLNEEELAEFYARHDQYMV
jgi:mannose-6-phosphate isomerase-like protein (cupin superfamily)